MAPPTTPGARSHTFSPTGKLYLSIHQHYKSVGEDTLRSTSDASPRGSNVTSSLNCPATDPKRRLKGAPSSGNSGGRRNNPSKGCWTDSRSGAGHEDRDTRKGADCGSQTSSKEETRNMMVMNTLTTFLTSPLHLAIALGLASRTQTGGKRRHILHPL
jgi:hypothetical protein